MLHYHYTLEPDIDYPLYITAKQYWCPGLQANWDDPDAFTLILLHSTSFHKETWEPTLQHLFEDSLKHQHVPTYPKIKSAWVIECPNHGESAVMNRLALHHPQFHHNFGCEKYAEAAHRFMLRGPTSLSQVDFRHQRLAGIGHSLGGVSISILPTLEPAVHFCALILVEPMLSPKGMDKLQDLRVHLINCARERRDAWPSRQDAVTYFRKRTRWDPRVVDCYVQHGLKAREGAGHMSDHQEVTLACSREEEMGMYQDMTGPQRGIESLNKLSGTTPVGVIFGNKNDYIPREAQDALIDPTSGRCIRDVRYIDGVGHLVPQHTPAELSRVLLDVWCRLVASIDMSCKL